MFCFFFALVLSIDIVQFDKKKSFVSIGEYFVSLKGYKIPLKSPEKNESPCDMNNPPPPGTEDETQQKNHKDSYVSPLAAVKRPPQPRIENPPALVQSPIKAAPLQNSDNSPSKTTKRSSLFSKLNAFIFQKKVAYEKFLL